MTLQATSDGDQTWTCVRCQRPTITPKRYRPGLGYVRGAARRLCGGCYSWADYQGVLDDYERVRVERRTSDETYSDFLVLRAFGLKRQEIADRLGIRLDALDRACDRQRAKLRALESTARRSSLPA